MTRTTETNRAENDHRTERRVSSRCADRVIVSRMRGRRRRIRSPSLDSIATTAAAAVAFLLSRRQSCQPLSPSGGATRPVAGPEAIDGVVVHAPAN